MSCKFQMVLPNDLAADLRSAAEQQGVPLAQFIRETMERRLTELRAPASGTSILTRLRGLGAGIPDADLSASVDQYLYGPDRNS